MDFAKNHFQVDACFPRQMNSCVFVCIFVYGRTYHAPLLCNHASQHRNPSPSRRRKRCVHHPASPFSYRVLNYPVPPLLSNRRFCSSCALLTACCCKTSRSLVSLVEPSQPFQVLRLRPFSVTPALAIPTWTLVGWILYLAFPTLHLICRREPGRFFFFWC